MEEKSIIPLYQRIRIQILKDISTGSLKIGDAIDTENVFMKKYHASRTTVRNAISSLAEEGIISRKPGKGSFVKKKPPKTKVKLVGTFEDILNVIKTTAVNVLRFEYVKPPIEAVEKLGLKDGGRVLRIDRVRFVDDTPFMYSINYMPEDIGKYLSIVDIEESVVTELLVSKCRQVLKGQVQEFGADIADDYMAKLLKIPVGFPLLEIRRVTLSRENRPINMFISHFRSDVYVYTATFSYEDQMIK